MCLVRSNASSRPAAGAAIDLTGSSCGSDAAAAALADRAKSESLPRWLACPRYVCVRVCVAVWAVGVAIPSACGNASRGRHSNVTSQQPLPVPPSLFRFASAHSGRMAWPIGPDKERVPGLDTAARTGKPEDEPVAH